MTTESGGARWPSGEPAPPEEVAAGDEARAKAGRGTWRRLARLLVRTWPILRFAVGLGLAALALWALGGHRGELSEIGDVLGQLRWWWVIPAAGVELCSYLSFARMQHRLLRIGGLRVPMAPLLGVTMAAQSVNNSLPAGSALSALYGFRWYRRLGADYALAAWALIGTLVGAAISLALVAALGVAMATSEGASLGLITVVVGVLGITAVAGAVLFYERPLAVAVSSSIRAVRRVAGRPRGDVQATVDRVVDRITVVRPGWSDAVAVVGFGLGSWILDCGCFALSFWAVGAPIPWKGLLLAYGAGQLAANLPITPGGLGAVEGSITIALVAFGGAQNSTVAAVLIYRLISFWAELPVGWSCAGVLALGVRRGRWPQVGVLARAQEITGARAAWMGRPPEGPPPAPAGSLDGWVRSRGPVAPRRGDDAGWGS